MNANTTQTDTFRETMEKIWPIWVSGINNYDNIFKWWEIIKIRIKQLTIEISKSLNINEYKLEKLGKRLNTIKHSDKNIHKQESKNLQNRIKQYYENKQKQLR